MLFTEERQATKPSPAAHHAAISEDIVEQKHEPDLYAVGEAAVDGPSTVVEDGNESDGSGMNRFSGGSFEGTDDLPEADQTRMNSKRQARQNWILALRKITAEHVFREEENRFDEEYERKKVKELLAVSEETLVDKEEGIKEDGERGEKTVILMIKIGIKTITKMIASWMFL